MRSGPHHELSREWTSDKRETNPPKTEEMLYMMGIPRLSTINSTLSNLFVVYAPQIRWFLYWFGEVEVMVEGERWRDGVPWRFGRHRAPKSLLRFGISSRQRK